MGFLFCLTRGLGRTILLLVLLLLIRPLILNAPLAFADFDPYSFIHNNTTFYPDFEKLRGKWFAVENQVFGIEDPNDPVDWSKIRDKAEWVVYEHERMMLKFIEDSRSALSKLKGAEVKQAKVARARVLEYIDSVGMVVLKLYEITEKLYDKTIDPYSYSMTDYNLDINQFKKLYEAYQTKGTELNRFLYGQ